MEQFEKSTKLGDRNVLEVRCTCVIKECENFEDLCLKKI